MFTVFVPGDFRLLFYFASSNDQLLGGLGGVTNSHGSLFMCWPLTRFEFAISMAEAQRLLCSLWRGGAAIVRSGPSEWSRSQISRGKRSETYITLEKLLLPLRRNDLVAYARQKARAGIGGWVHVATRRRETPIEHFPSASVSPIPLFWRTKCRS